MELVVASQTIQSSAMVIAMVVVVVMEVYQEPKVVVVVFELSNVVQVEFVSLIVIDRHV